MRLLSQTLLMITMMVVVSPSYAQASHDDALINLQEKIENNDKNKHQLWLDVSLAWLNLAANEQWQAPTNCTLPFDALLAKDDNMILVDCQLLRTAKTQKETQAILIILAAQNLDGQRPFYQKPSVIEQIAGTAAQITASDPDETHIGLGSAFRETEFKRPRNDNSNHVAARSLFWMQESGVCTGALQNYLTHIQNDDNLKSGSPLRSWAKNVRLQMGSALYNPDYSCL